MKDIISVALVLVALAFYAAAYVLPLTLVLSALLRMALRWHSNWRLIIAATAAALPQAAIVIYGIQAPDWLLYSLVALVVVSAGLYLRAIRGYRTNKILLEIFMFIAVLVYMLSGVKWIVG